jgi:membrane protein required for colicin V production
VTGGEIGAGAAPFITGAVILVATIGLVGFLGRYLKRGAKAVGLGWADRIGGGALGFAEGALVATLLVSGATLVFGRDHESIEQSRSVEAVEKLQEYVSTNYGDELDQLPDVAAPLRR